MWYKPAWRRMRTAHAPSSWRGGPLKAPWSLASALVPVEHDERKFYPGPPGGSVLRIRGAPDRGCFSLCAFWRWPLGGSWWTWPRNRRLPGIPGTTTGLRPVGWTPVIRVVSWIERISKSWKHNFPESPVPRPPSSCGKPRLPGSHARLALHENEVRC